MSRCDGEGRGEVGNRQKRSTGGCRLCYTIVATRWMELIKRYRFSRPLVLPAPFPIAAATAAVVAVFTRWALRIELQTPRERGSRCLLLSFLPRPRYDRPSPPTLSVPTPFHFAAAIAKLSADIRKYREREYLDDPRTFHGTRDWGEEEEGRTGWGSRTTCPLLAGGIENFVKRGRRRVPGL